MPQLRVAFLPDGVVGDADLAARCCSPRPSAPLAEHTTMSGQWVRHRNELVDGRMASRLSWPR